MRFGLRSVSLCAALVLSACGGGGGSVPAAPVGATDGRQAVARSPEAIPTGVIYVAFAHHVNVYPKAATGFAAPIRSITGLTETRSIAVDRFGNLYVGEATSWTVRKFAPTAHGNAAPLKVFTASDPQPAGASTHSIVAIGLRYDGGIAVLAQRTSGGQSSLTVGVFDPGYGGFDIVKQLPEYGSSLAVDGSGNILFGHGSDQPGIAAFIERLSPHPYGYHDDGDLANFNGFDLSRGAGLFIAASGHDDVQVNFVRWTENDGPGLDSGNSVTQLTGERSIRNMSFDVAGRLFLLTVGPGAFPAKYVETFPPVIGVDQPAIRRFYLPVGSNPKQLAVTD